MTSTTTTNRTLLMSSCAAVFLSLMGAPAADARVQTQDATTVEAALTGVTSYSAAALSANAPANAREMLDRLPGFILVGADSDVRGYAGAQGNVLIDGARPTSKREDINDLLRRIPARSVERIELIRGGVGGVDMAGYTIVANVIRQRHSNGEAMVEIGALTTTSGWSAASGHAQYIQNWGERSLDLALKVEPGFDDDSGRGWIRTQSPDGILLDHRLEDTRETQSLIETALVWTQPLAGGRLNASAALRSDRARGDAVLAPVDAPLDPEQVQSREDLTEGEVGLRYQRGLGEATKLDAIFSQRLSDLKGHERAEENGDVESFAESTRTGESIARMDVTHRRSDTLSFAAGLEGAFNFLESEARLEQDGAPVFLPGSDVRIEEKRVEGSAGLTWTPVEPLVVEMGLRVEASSILQTGDSPLERDFIYAKPRLAISWDVTNADQLRLGVSRDVGQLDFEDFVASASLSTGVVAVGNAELEPDKTWRFVAAWERQFWDEASVTLTWTYDVITDVVDRVLIITPDDAFDAPGNIGAGRRNTLELDLNAPLDKLGVKGGRLRTALMWRTSQVTDPATGQSRRISEERPVEGEIAFTQALPHWRSHWGVTLKHIAERKTRYRFDDIRRRSEDLGWTVFAERRLGAEWRLRAEATDLFGRRFHETREKYDGPRSAMALDEIERRERRSPGYVSVTLRRNMGG